jgi:hypothetical protein
MKIDAKCGCGAALELRSDSDETFAEARVMDLFRKWNDTHAACGHRVAWPGLPALIPNNPGWPDGTIICEASHK